ncbi:MAG: phosphoribosylformylglycinamidine synthase subunit PurL [Abitibacteriaceae bacterium]|nr:phosphoribosylformylglycinamidine synthase subunit PurL [Abditibacteriaceae bacterium]
MSNLQTTEQPKEATPAPNSQMVEKAKALGMTEDEYKRVTSILNREPSPTELAMYSVEWSEHCGYPRSRALLKTLPKEGHFASVTGADTGGIEIEPGLFVVFKMESHNHPSQVEPKQGAATGIGGIIRDIFTVGARPLACLDSLRFGPLEEARARYLFNGVVEGISFYGNCMGIPTVAGEVGFNPSYRGNCLVGAMCVGVVHRDQLASSAASGVGNLVMYFGNATGRDGIGGCSILASREITDAASRPTVQIGDPFAEKCLLEACLEALQTGAIVSLKDMGAAGLTCTTCEQAAEGGVGMDIDLAQVPLRESDMEPFEIMMSESQERMLGVIKAGREAEVAAIFRRWGLHVAVLGQVTGDGILRVRQNGQVVAEMTASSLVDSPLYDLPFEEPAYLRDKHSFDFSQIPLPANYTDILLRLLQSPNIASKAWVYQQYDHLVQINTVVRPGAGDAAVLRIRESASNKGIAVKADCNSRYCYLDPFVGAQIAIAECARNLVCVGAEPGGVTDCLCFGNPEKPDRFWQFKRAIEGIVVACKHFHLPVVSGNVSFYNETPESVIHPSPLIGMVGVLDNVEQSVGLAFRTPGDVVLLVGQCLDELGGSEYLATLHGLEVGHPPELNLERELNAQKFTLAAIRGGLAKSAHDVSDGGLGVALAECCIEGGIGAKIELPDTAEAAINIRLDAVLFGESQSRIVLTAAPENLPRLQELARAAGVPLSYLGNVGGDRLTIADNRAGVLQPLLDAPVVELASVYHNAIPALMNS